MSEIEAGFFEYKPLQPYTQMELQALYEQWTREERERIVNWIEENRSKIELEAGIFVYRDHFDSESLLNFINENNEKV